MRTSRLAIALASAAALLLATPAAAVEGWGVEKVALEGEIAPDSGGAVFDSFDVTLGSDGEVGFTALLSGSTPSWALFRHSGGTTTAASTPGETAPGTGGSYRVITGFPVLRGGGLSFPAFVENGSAATGLFLDAAGGDSAIVLEGEAAPGTGGGSFEAAISDLNLHGINASGDAAFRSGIVGGSAAKGVFRRTGAGTAAVALLGDAAPGGGSYSDLGNPSINGAAQVAFSAVIAGGPAPTAIVVDTGAGASAVLSAGDPAPDSGGGSLADFVYPAINDAGALSFVGAVSGGTATGGYFVHSAGETWPAAVEFGEAPDTGGGTYVSLTSLPNLNVSSSVAFGALLAGGSVAAGVFHVSGVDRHGEAVALAGELAPDAGGADFDSFGYVALNDANQVAFVAQLSDGREGLFLATPTSPVPALPPLALLALAAGLLAAGRPLAGRPGAH